MTSGISPYRFRDGLHDGIPIALGYFFVAMGFGVSAVGQGLRALEALFISMTSLTSAGQLAGVSIIAAGGTALEMALTQLVINLRYSLMGVSLSQRLDDRCNGWRRLYLACSLTDEIFAIASAKPHRVGASYLMGMTAPAYLGWALGTLIGSCGGQILPERLQAASGLMIYAMFIAVIVPPMKKEKGVLAVAAISAGLSCILAFVPVFRVVSSGFSIIICAVAAAAVISLICPVPDEEQDGADAD